MKNVETQELFKAFEDLGGCKEACLNMPQGDFSGKQKASIFLFKLHWIHIQRNLWGQSGSAVLKGRSHGRADIMDLSFTYGQSLK